MAKKMPVISITGPRQSGKTTLAKLCFPEHDYVNLEDLRHREFALTDPTGFFKQFKKGVIIDEAQYIPEIFSYIQVISDESKQNGKFILTGSQHFLLLEKITQSLAGRVSIFHLLPFSMSELKKNNLLSESYEEVLFKGFYPRVYVQKLNPPDFYSSYIQSYIERDLRQLRNIGNLSAFQKLLGLCAGRVGQIVNFATLSNDCGLDQKTVKQWLSLMETCFIIFFLQPYYKNFNKRLIKSPKLYFYDTGLACYLLGINEKKELKNIFYKGALFENLIIAEKMKNYFHNGLRARLYFWRDNTGNEIDCINEEHNLLIATEIKSGSTIHSDFWKGLDYLKKIASPQKVESHIVYGGDMNQKRSNVNIHSWRDI